ncbi:MAG: DNA polymerase III subunit epsilon, partial [Pseudomonadota bacterium]
MREIVLDTETTGLDPNNGDRLVEIGCVELHNRYPTGNNYHVYINPQRSMPEEAFRVHGLSSEFLSDKPTFDQVAQDFLDFIGEDMLVIHNANFDIGFLNAELGALDLPRIGMHRVTDTLALARRRHPGARNSLDALCDRYKLDNSARVLHGALLDSEILADVYVHLLGIQQGKFELGAGAGGTGSDGAGAAGGAPGAGTAEQRPVPLASRLNDAERTAHAAFIKTLGEDALWH